MPRRHWSFFMPVEDHMFMKRLFAYHHARLTDWGKMMFWMAFVGAAVASPGTHISAYLLPSFLIALLSTSFFLALIFRPKITAKRILPSPPSAGGFCIYSVLVKNIGKRPLRNLAVYESMLPFGIYPAVHHEQFNNTIEWLDPGKEARVTLVIRTPMRGIYELPNLYVGTSFPSGIMRIPRKIEAREKFVVYPKFVPQTQFQISQRRTFQPGGIAESSKVGDSNEFLSTREFRYGDRLRDVHWPSTARADELIVKEYVEEYLVRIGLILDTHFRKREKSKAFEGRIAFAAGVAEALDRRDHIIDLFTTDEKIPHLQMGRSLAHLDHLLEMFSFIEGDLSVDFNKLITQLKIHTSHLSSVVIILGDWNEPRYQFVEELKELGPKIRTVIVRDTSLTMEPGEDITVISSKQTQGAVV